MVSPLIRRLSGLPSSWGRLSRGRLRRAICCAIAIESSAQTFVKQMKAMGIKELLSAPRSPWQRAYVERVIGIIRRECLDHVIALIEAGLYRQLREFADYYHRSRTHLGLQKDTPESRQVQEPEAGRIVAIPRWAGSIIATNVALLELRTAVELSHRNKAPYCRLIGGPFLRCGPSNLGDAE